MLLFQLAKTMNKLKRLSFRYNSIRVKKSIKIFSRKLIFVLRINLKPRERDGDLSMSYRDQNFVFNYTLRPNR